MRVKLPSTRPSDFAAIGLLIGFHYLFWTKIWHPSYPFQFWSYLHANFSEFSIGVFGTCLVSFISYWFFNSLFYTVDHFEGPRWLYQYKVQPKEHVDPVMLKKAIKQVLFNLTFVTFFIAVVNYYAMKWRGSSFSPFELPSLYQILRDFAVSALVNEVGFYYTHRFDTLLLRLPP